MNEKNELDILIPVFNENENIIKTLKNIKSVLNFNYNILICYDYDADPTIKIIKENFPNSKKILFIKNFSRGYNNALISGFKNTTGKAILIFMADDHINHNMINLCYEKFKEGYDVVCPSRFVKGGKMIGNPFLKSILKNIYSYVLDHYPGQSLRSPRHEV